MVEDYKIYLGRDMSLTLVNSKDEVDMSNFISVSESSFKKMFTLGQRRRYSSNRDLESGTYILTYPDNSIELVSPEKGDFVNPGFRYVSCELTGEISNVYTKRDILRRCKWKSLTDDVVFNGMLICSSLYRNMYIYRSSPDVGLYAGWTLLLHDGAYSCPFNSYTYVLDNTNLQRGICKRDESPNLFISQNLKRDKVEAMDRIAFRLTDQEGNPYNADMVLLGSSILQYNSEDNYWCLNGELPEGDEIPLSIKLNSTEILYLVEECRD